MRVNSKTNGIRELVQSFDRSPEVFTRHMKLALNQNLRDVQLEAMAKHRFIPSKVSHLEKSVTTTDADDNLIGKVHLDTGIARYANWVHEGTRPHKITPVNALYLRWATGKGLKFARSVMHPGCPPDQFLYKALETKKDSIQHRYVDAINNARLEVGL